jgi:hypothetical protein
VQVLKAYEGVKAWFHSSEPRHWMEMVGLLHDPTALTLLYLKKGMCGNQSRCGQFGAE